MDYEKINIDGYPIEVKFDKNSVHIKNDGNLKKLLKRDIKNSVSLCKGIKFIYEEIYGCKLNINTLSMSIEILGHIYPDDFAKEIKYISNKIGILEENITNLADEILNHTDIIDIGEIEYDDNRWFWDSIERIFNIIGKVFSK